MENQNLVTDLFLVVFVIGIFVLLIKLARWKGRSVGFHIIISIIISPLLSILYLLLCKKNISAMIESGKKQTCPFCFEIIDSEIDSCPLCKENLFLPNKIVKNEENGLIFYDLDGNEYDFTNLKHKLLIFYSEIGLTDIVKNEDERIIVRQNENLKNRGENLKPYFRLTKDNNLIKLELYKVKQPNFFSGEKF